MPLHDSHIRTVARLSDTMLVASKVVDGGASKLEELMKI
jgi:hypothetical protein